MDDDREKQIQEMTDKIFNEMKEKEASQTADSNQTADNSQPSEQKPEQMPAQQPEGYFKKLVRQTFSIESMSGAGILLNVVAIATSLWQYRDFTLHIRECSKTDPSCGAAGGWVFFFVILPLVIAPWASGLLATIFAIIRAFIKLTKGNKLSTLAIVLLVASTITAIAAFIAVKMMWTF